MLGGNKSSTQFQKITIEISDLRKNITPEIWLVALYTVQNFESLTPSSKYKFTAEDVIDV